MCFLDAEVTRRYFYTVSLFAVQSPDPHWSNQNGTSAEMESVCEGVRLQVMQSWAEEVACTSHSISCCSHHAGRHVLCSMALSMQHRYPQRAHTTQMTFPDGHPGLSFPKSPGFYLLRDAGDSWHMNPEYLQRDHKISLVCFKLSNGA